jgi:hypothetical protein
LSVLQQKISTEINKETALTPAQITAAYKKQADTFGDARTVHYMLWPSQSSATAALAKLNSGTAESKASTGAIDADTLHGTAGYVAASGPGLMDTAFQKAAFALKQGAWGAPVLVDDAYAKSSLAGKCKPHCYFLINPVSPVAKAGTPEAQKLLKDQINAKLNPQGSSSSKAQAKILALLNPIKKNIHYAKGYAPPATSSTGSAAPAS